MSEKASKDGGSARPAASRRHIDVKALAGWLCVFPLALTAEVDLARLLKGIENRYNQPKTLQLSFEQSHVGGGRIAQVEKGEVYLQRPGRMLWDYSQPDGKFFLSDGKFAYFYSPNTRQVSKSKLKETDDMRAPLAFLVGKLDFDRYFQEYRTRPEGNDIQIVTKPKSAKAPYTEVAFLVSPDNYQIKLLTVTGQDQSVMRYRFTGEQLNPKFAPLLFELKVPEGAQLVEEDR